MVEVSDLNSNSDQGLTTLSSSQGRGGRGEDYPCPLFTDEGMVVPSVHSESESASYSVMPDSFATPQCSPLGSSVHGILQTRILE